MCQGMWWGLEGIWLEIEEQGCPGEKGGHPRQKEQHVQGPRQEREELGQQPRTIAQPRRCRAADETESDRSVRALGPQLCPTLCHPVDCRLPGSFRLSLNLPELRHKGPEFLGSHEIPPNGFKWLSYAKWSTKRLLYSK